MVGWRHRHSEHEFEKSPGNSAGQESLAAAHRIPKSQSDLGDGTTTTAKRVTPQPIGSQRASQISATEQQQQQKRVTSRFVSFKSVDHETFKVLSTFKEIKLLLFCERFTFNTSHLIESTMIP